MFATAALVALCQVGSALAGDQPLGAADTWNSKFVDGFDSNSVGSTWDTSLGDWTGTAPGAFKASNAGVSGGNLRLRTTYSTTFNPFAGTESEQCDCGFENIATSMVVSKERFQHGFFEVRARAAESTLMNSFWLQGDHSEINVMEFVSDSTKGFERSGHHCWTDGSDQVEDASSVPLAKPIADRTAWHTYGVQWSSAEIKFFVDGELARTLVKADYSVTRPECMDEPMNIVLSVETSAEAGAPASFSGSKLFLVDYVHHWDSIAPPTTTTPMARTNCAGLSGSGFKLSAKAKAGFEDVCVGKFGLFSKCSHLRKDENMRTHAEAEEQCSAQGARLCTSLELSKNVGKAIGCNFAQKRYIFTSDTNCPAGEVSTAFGMYKKSKPAECVPADTKLHVRCCSDVDLSKPQTGDAATGAGSNSGSIPVAAPQVGGAASFEDEGEDGEDGEDGEEDAGSGLGSVVAGLGVVLVIAGVIVGVALNRRQDKAIAALNRDLDRSDPEAGRRASFEDCIDAVSASGSLGSIAESMDVVPSYAHDNVGANGNDLTVDPASFEENGFVLDGDHALRVQSVRRGNPAYLQSVYSTNDIANTQDTIETDSAM